MLEIRDICKTYRAKSGVEVKALDHVSLTFPETGMIFLLGKSGSGKSTLLNVIGGLDTFDSGELVIRGRSSRTFRRSDFDSYRNTFIGFIFQEYNILDDFSVGANIGLALELQGKRATEEAINRILNEVDLAGFGNRKPNELSGGQKQRIAIARALIKEPQIIMADEPTGALDSTTGAQVLETLKQLSAHKLVVVVSHDREFAERYGDRIIELADGCVISDTTFTEGETVTVATPAGSAPIPDKGMHIVSDHQICIAENYVLTAEDLAAINAYLASHKNDVLLSRVASGAPTRVSAETGVSASAGTRVRRPTERITPKTYSKEEAKLIRSRLPMRKAAKMGLSSIKSKPIRLLFTILLSLVAFTLFGYSATAIFYNEMDAATDSLRDMKNNTIVMSLRLKETYNTWDEFGELDYTDTYFGRNDAFNDADIAALEAASGVKFFPVYNGYDNSYSSIGLGDHIKESERFYNQMSGNVFDTNATGITEVTAEDMTALGFTLRDDIAGNRMPTAPGEIAISYYHYMMFMVGGFVDADGKSHTSILGQRINVTLNGGDNIYLTIVGVIDTGFRFEDYPALLWDAESSDKYRNKDISEMREKLEKEITNSFHTMLMGAEGTLDALPKLYNSSNKEWGTYTDLNVGVYRGEKNELITWYISHAINADQAKAFDIIWADGETDRDLARNDYVISAEYFFNIVSSSFLWSVTPIEHLAPYLRDAGLSNEEGQPVPLSNHLETTVIEDKDAPNGYTEQYIYAQWLGISDEAYETQLVSAFNEAFGITLTIDEYKGLYNNWWAPFLNEITDENLYNEFRLHLWRELYNNYGAYSQTLFDDTDFYRSTANWYSIDTNHTTVWQTYSRRCLRRRGRL